MRHSTHILNAAHIWGYVRIVHKMFKISLAVENPILYTGYQMKEQSASNKRSFRRRVVSPLQQPHTNLLFFVAYCAFFLILGIYNKRMKNIQTGVYL